MQVRKQAFCDKPAGFQLDESAKQNTSFFTNDAALTFDTTGHAVPSGDGWADMCRQLTALHQLDGDALARVAHAVQAHPDWPISTLARWARVSLDEIAKALPDVAQLPII